jgi:zinc/manganese transport system permease protein
MFELMLPAFVASLILLAVHAYLGLHVIARGVIFVDLALAQVAALGWAAANLGVSHWLNATLGVPEEAAGYMVGVVATFVAAALFSVSRFQHKYVPQEALIGIVFVVASALTLLVASQGPRGHEDVEQLFTGTLLWVTWPQILRVLIAYVVIGAVHIGLRHRFLTISLDPAAAQSKGWALRWWDFLFYALFGVVVTYSVSIAGVLVVFSFLVIPAVIAFLFATAPAGLIIVAYTSGIVATVLGLILSFTFDLPTGPLIVCTFALTLITAFLLRRVLPTPAGEVVLKPDGAQADQAA